MLFKAISPLNTLSIWLLQCTHGVKFPTIMRPSSTPTPYNALDSVWKYYIIAHSAVATPQGFVSCKILELFFCPHDYIPLQHL